MRPLVGATLAPGRTRCMPLITIRSSRCRPARTMRRPRSRLPGSTTRCSGMSSLPSAQTNRRDWSLRMALSGMSSASNSPEPSELQASELPRGEEAAGVGDERAAGDRASRRVDAVVDEVHLADVRERRLIEQPDAHRIGHVARGPPFAAGVHAVVFQVVRLARIEHELDRIDGDDRRQQRRSGLTAGDHVADAHEFPRDAATDRRAHARELHVQRRDALGGAGHDQRRFGFLARLRPAVEFLLADAADREQRLAASEVGRGQLHARLRAHDVCPGPFECGFVRPRIDHEQQVTGFDDRTVAEMNGVEIPVDAGANVHAIGRLEAAGVLVPFGQPHHQR